MGHKYFNSHILFIFLVSFLFSYFAAFKCLLFRWRRDFSFIIIVSVTEHPEEMELLSVKKLD